VNILLIGDLERHEFREARLAMDACGAVVETADVAAACAVLDDEERAFDLIVLATAYPGQFSDEAVERLRRLSPLSRVVGLLGTWCEGEMRSGHPLPGAIRVYWHQWAQRLEWESARWHDGLRCSWGLPVTAGEEERVLALAETPIPRRSGLIAVCSQEHAIGDWLCATCRRTGYTAEWLRPSDPLGDAKPAAGIFDASDRPQQCEDLRRFAAALHPAPVVAIIGFPRVEDRDRALDSGAASVLSKPLLVEDLLLELDRGLAKVPAK
jgi:CheY-like chemotaxis protein